MSRWFNDTYVLFAIESKRFTRQAAVFVFNSLIAAAVFFLFRLVADPPPEVELRLLAGAMVFGVAMQSINATGQIMVSERFEGQMKLFRTSSISQASYVVAVTVFSAATAALTALVVLGLAAAAGVHLSLSPLLIPLIVLTGLALPGFAVLIATHAKTAQAGYMLSNAVGIMLVMVSPIFYPIERLPEALQWLARLSPFTYAGQAIHQTLSGGTAIIVPVCILLAFTVAANAIGIAKMRWREP